MFLWGLAQCDPKWVGPTWNLHRELWQNRDPAIMPVSSRHAVTPGSRGHQGLGHMPETLVSLGAGQTLEAACTLDPSKRAVFLTAPICSTGELHRQRFKRWRCRSDAIRSTPLPRYAALGACIVVWVRTRRHCCDRTHLKRPTALQFLSLSVVWPAFIIVAFAWFSTGFKPSLSRFMLVCSKLHMVGHRVKFLISLP